MHKPLALFIGLRFVRARKSSQLMSFVSWISMLGIALGVLALIIVLSVINASTSTMREETLKAVPHASLALTPGSDWQEAVSLLVLQPGVTGAAPYVEAQAWLRFEGLGEFINVRGVDPHFEPDVMQGTNPHLAALLEQLQRTPDGIILGTRLAATLGLFTDQQPSVTPLASLISRQTSDARSFRVLGVADFGFYDNDRIALTNLEAARQLFAADPGAALQIRLRVADVFAAEPIARQALTALPAGDYQLDVWNQSRRSLFDALRMEKILTGFMLLMIVVIGAVNIVSTLVMAVADKSADIAILRTMGAGRATVMAVFVVQGFAAGILGTLLGAAAGITLSLFIGDLSRWFEGWLNNRVAPDDVYMIAHLSAELQWQDVLLVCASALLISLLATLYPAWRAARVHPADVLRYE